MGFFSTMFTFIKSILDSGIPDDGPSREDLFAINRIRVINLCSLMFLIVCPVAMALPVLTESMVSTGLAGLAFSALAVDILYSRRKKNPSRSAHVLALVFSLFIIATSINTGGFTSPFMLWLFLLPVGAAFAITSRASIFYGLLAALIIALFMLAHSLGMDFKSVIPGKYTLVIYSVHLFLLLFVIVLLLFYFQSNQSRTLAWLYQSEKKFKKLSLKAEKNSLIKSEFLANMSHEIRTPMNGIIGMMHLLLESGLSDDQKRYSTIVFNSAKGLLTILNDILDFSKIEAGKLDLDIRNFDLLLAMEDMNAMFALLCEQKGIAYDFKVKPGTPTLLRGDPGRVRQVLTNLTGNAIKFTESGGVTVSVEPESGGEGSTVLRFTVSDTGIGIAPDKIEGLFETFTQADTSTTRLYGGTGLGLAISKLLVKKMNGDLRAESEELIGSTFSFTIPFEDFRPELENTISFAGSLKNKRVLIVSDNSQARESIKKQLDSMALFIEETDSLTRIPLILETASLQNKPFHAAILDIQKPGNSIEGLGRVVKHSERTRDVQLIVISSCGQKGEARCFESAGFSAYLSKPLDPYLLTDCLKAVLCSPGNGKLVTRHSIAESKKQSAMNILIVEDQETNRIVATELLARQGYKADTARNGKEALEALDKKVYDLIFMDCQMPVMDGFTCTEEIRKKEAGGRRTPIVAMTANALKGVREKCLEAGMDNYITKPVNPEDLSRIIFQYVPSGHIQEAPLKANESSPVDDDAREHTIFDMTSMLKRFGGDQELVGIVLDSFLEESPELMGKLKKAVAMEDLEAVESCSHALKGSSANVNAWLINRAAVNMEKTAKANDRGQLPSRLHDLELEFEKFTKEMTR